MNSIDTAITESDKFNGKGKSAASLAQDILQSLKQACPYGTTFAPDIPFDCRVAAEAYFKTKFELWANSWVAPRCREIIAKQTP